MNSPSASVSATRSPISPAPLLRVEALSASRGQHCLFTGLSFALNAGEGLHLQGANGAGKTTLMRILAGLGRADSGQVHYAATAGSLSGRDALLFYGHSAGVSARLNAVENLDWWLSLHAEPSFLQGLTRPQRRAVCEEALKQVGLFEQQLLPAADLSAGQKRRVALARLFLPSACISHKRIWLLDEPLTSLDAGFCKVVLQRLAAHLAAGGVAVLVSHQPPDGLEIAALQLEAFQP